MADSETVFDEVYAPDGSIVARVPRVRDRVLSDADIRTLRQNCRDIMNNAALPIWGRALARAVLGLTWEPGTAQPAVGVRGVRRLDEHGNDLPDEAVNGRAD